MCVEGAGTLLTLGSGLLKAGGAEASGQSSARAAMLQSSIAQENAKTAALRGTFEQNRIADRVDDVLGGQVGSLAARGIDPGTGSPLVMAGLTAAQGETDRAIAGARAAQEGASAMWQAYGGASRADDAKRAAKLGVASAFLTTAGSLSGGSGFDDVKKAGRRIGSFFGSFG